MEAGILPKRAQGSVSTGDTGRPTQRGPQDSWEQYCNKRSQQLPTVKPQGAALMQSATLETADPAVPRKNGVSTESTGWLPWKAPGLLGAMLL